MSYILDALKKSEQQRNALLNQQEMVATSDRAPAGSRRWQIAMLMTIALLAGWGLSTLLGDQSPDQSASTPIPKPAGIAPPSNSPSKPAAQADSVQSVDPVQSVDSEQNHHRVEADKPVQSHPPVLASVTPDHNIKAIEPRQPTAAFQPVTPSSPISRVDTHLPALSDLPELPVDPNAVAPAEEDIPSVSELPVAIQQSLPAIDIQGHIYDDNPAERMVIINGHIRREKQSAGQGLKLEEITPSGVIMSYQSHIFHLSVFGR